jgi:hypothetical protein
MVDLKRLTGEVGIKLHPDKMQMLVPPSAPPPDTSAFPDDIPPLPLDLVIRMDGLKVAGAAIGTEIFVAQDAVDKVKSIGKIIERLYPLSDIDPQTAFFLLIKMAIPSVTYMGRVTPASMMEEAMTDFDGRLGNACLRMLSLGSCAPKPNRKRTRRALAKFRLPTRFGGMGLASLDTLFPAAFLGSFASALSDPALRDLATHIEHHACRAHENVMKALGGVGEIAPGSALAAVLPLEAADICRSQFYLNLFTNKPMVQVQHVISKSIAARQRLELLKQAKPAENGVTVRSGGFTPSDCSQTVLTTTRSQISRIWTSDLGYEDSRVPCKPFVRFARYIFGLPNLLMDPSDATKSDHSLCLVGRCLSCLHKHPGREKHRYELDPTGDHASSGCSTVMGTRYLNHNGISKMLGKFGIEAGLEVDLEPPTSAVLEGAFTDEECRMLFPKNGNKGAKQLAKKAAIVALEIQDAEWRSDAPKAAQGRQHLLRLRRDLADSTQGRRIDIYMRDPLSRDSKFVDVAGVHPTAHSYIKATAKFARKIVQAEVEAKESGGVSEMVGEVSPRILAVELSKHRTYGLLGSIADHQKRLGTRQGSHEFVPAICTHYGELGSPFFNLIEWMTGQYKRHCRGVVRADGRAERFVTADYRRRLKDAIFARIATGFGGMLDSVGIPVSGRLWGG